MKIRIKKDNKFIISSIVIGVLIILLLILLLVKGCSNNLTVEQKQLKSAADNTSIGSKGVESYRAKISISGKGNNKLNQNYIVYNYNNKKFDITIFDGTKSSKVSIKKGEKNNKLKYNYTDTNLFLKGLEKGNNIKSEKKKIGDEEYTIYEFNIEKNIVNDMLKPFNIKNKSDGTGKVYIDSKGKIYLVMYDTNDVSLSASYTRLNQINK